MRAGDQVGELGNSGNTDSPHLHLRLMDGPDPLASNGLPYQFDTQKLVGQATGTDAVNTLFTGQPLPLVPDGPTGERTDEMPLHLDVVDLVAGTQTEPSGSSATPSGSGSTTVSSSAG